MPSLPAARFILQGGSSLGCAGNPGQPMPARGSSAIPPLGSTPTQGGPDEGNKEFSPGCQCLNGFLNPAGGRGAEGRALSHHRANLFFTHSLLNQHLLLQGSRKCFLVSSQPFGFYSVLPCPATGLWEFRNSCFGCVFQRVPQAPGAGAT